MTPTHISLLAALLSMPLISFLCGEERYARSLVRDPTAVRQPGCLLFDRPLGFAPPPRGGFAFLAAPEHQRS